MVLGKHCKLHQGTFGVWPNEPCPWHDEEPKKPLGLKEQPTREWAGIQCDTPQTVFNCDLRVTSASFTKTLQWAASLELKKAAYLISGSFQNEVRLRGSFIQLEGCVFNQPVFLSSPDVVIRDCEFHELVWLDNSNPAWAFHCLTSSHSPLLRRADFTASGLTWWGL